MTYRQKLQQRAKKNKETKAMKRFSAYDILIKPLITEKSYKTQESDNKYIFKIHKGANKNDVRKAVKYIYKVDPIKVNIVNVKLKGRMQRSLVRKAYKKAIITLGKKDKIDIHA